MTGLLNDKVVLVTGGASGIGRAAAMLFAREGAAVLVADLDEGAADAAAAAIDAEGGRAHAIRVDVADATSASRMVEAAVSTFGRLDGAFNNAGVIGHTPKFTRMAEYPDEDWRRLMNVNLDGVWHCMRAELRVMRATGGAIVNTASVAGARGYPGASAYAATKHAVIGLTRTAALEYASKNIRINAVLPGGVDTPMNHDMPDGWKDVVERTQPMRRVGRPEEIAEAACWLLSDRASFVTAQQIFVDGGWSETLNGA